MGRKFQEINEKFLAPEYKGRMEIPLYFEQGIDKRI
jgi:hypothetical protein